MEEERIRDAEKLEQAVEFHAEDIEFELANPKIIRHWTKQVIEREEKTLNHISYIFCSDSYLHDLNLQYLDHDTFTDIITFQYAKLPVVEGDIFISIDRIRENAAHYNVTFEDELHRVMSHGVLHLCGYRDKEASEKARMTEKEDQALQILQTSLNPKK